MNLYERKNKVLKEIEELQEKVAAKKKELAAVNKEIDNFEREERNKRNEKIISKLEEKLGKFTEADLERILNQLSNDKGGDVN